MSNGGIFAYVSHEGGAEIAVLRLDPNTGTLTQVQRVPTAGKALPMAVSPDRRFLYAAIHSEPYRVASFAIDALSGTLVHLGNAPLPERMPYISTDRTGRFLFAASIPESRPRLNNLLSVSAIGAHGFVQPPHQILRTEPKMHAILADPSNRYVFATSCDGGLILRYVFDSAAGRLLPDTLLRIRVKAQAGPRHFVFHPNGRFLYLLNEADASIYTFAFDVGTGTVTELQISSALPLNFGEEHPNAADLHLTPNGKFLYASERTSHTLGAFNVDITSGLLTPIATYATEKGPRGFNIDPYGRYLLAAGILSHRISVYAINSETGQLTKLNAYPTSEGPNWIEIVRLS